MKMKIKAKTLLLLFILLHSTTALGLDRNWINDRARPGLTFLCTLYQVFLAIAGAAATIYIVLQGLRWTASRDDPKQRKEILDRIKNILVGLLIILLAAALVQLMIDFDVDTICQTGELPP